MKRKHVFEIILLTVISCTFLFVIEQVLEVHYLVKTGSKVILFLVVPLLYIKFILGENIWESLRFNRIDRKRLSYGLGLGILSAIIILLAFIFLRDLIKPELIIIDLKERLGITFEVYTYIAIYIVFVNSLLEEFYFRGFIFLKFFQSDYKWLGYLFSSSLFAVYHVAIFATWFNVGVMFLVLFALFIVGMVFCWLNTKSNNFLNSWILHICADIAVVSIGYYLFVTL